MYIIRPCITGASKPNERLYQNNRLQHKTEERIEVRHRQRQEEHTAYVVIIEFEITGLYCLTYLNSRELCWKENLVFRTAGSQGNIGMDQRQVLKILGELNYSVPRSN
jgi:hypothetical protein